MTDDRARLMLQNPAPEDHFRGTLTTLDGIRFDIAHLKTRVDRIDELTGPRETEH